MRTRPILLSKTCPYCGARSVAEAKLPVPANAPMVEFNLDDLATLVEKQSLSQLLAVVELLPYKTFACRKCGGEFRMESKSTKALVHKILTAMRPVVTPEGRRKKPSPGTPGRRPAAVPVRLPDKAPTMEAADNKDWEAERLDALFDYSVEPEKK
jgi:hypothetical protein